jgi:tryptophan synthase alpha chain
MSRIDENFAKLKASGDKGFIPFITAGDPNMAASLEIVLKLAELGASVMEIGVPFSDPMADGLIIQRSSERALKNGASLGKILKMVEEVREETNMPIVLFSYLNPLLRFGLERLGEEAARIGIDGILITDVVDTEAAEIAKSLTAKGIDLISLVTPTTTDERLERICSAASGFIYAVSRAGVTGAQEETSSDAEKLVVRTRQFTDLPIAVGFGISTAEQIADVWRYADAAVVGSAIVAEIERYQNPADAPNRVAEFVKGLIPEFAKTTGEI